MTDNIFVFHCSVRKRVNVCCFCSPILLTALLTCRTSEVTSYLINPWIPTFQICDFRNSEFENFCSYDIPKYQIIDIPKLLIFDIPELWLSEITLFLNSYCSQFRYYGIQVSLFRDYKILNTLPMSLYWS